MFSIIFLQLGWLFEPKCTHVCYLITLSEDTGLWQLPKLHPAFNNYLKTYWQVHVLYLCLLDYYLAGCLHRFVIKCLSTKNILHVHVNENCWEEYIIVKRSQHYHSKIGEVHVLLLFHIGCDLAIVILKWVQTTVTKKEALGDVPSPKSGVGLSRSQCCFLHSEIATAIVLFNWGFFFF